LHLRCEDDGVGIAPDDLQRVFDKGFSTKSRDTNYGIGLHWCANADRRPGRPDVGRQRGSGDGRVHAFDAAFAAAGRIRRNPELRGCPCQKNRDHLPIRVLIADDEAGVRDAYRQILLEAT
jgi:hypothetical protein